MRRKKKQEHNSQPSVPLLLTPHAVKRMQERMPDDFALPEPNSFIRVLNMDDTFRKKKISLIRVHGGILVCKWQKRKDFKRIVVLTMMNTATFSRLQKRMHSRYIPVETIGYLLSGVVLQEPTN